MDKCLSSEDLRGLGVPCIRVMSPIFSEELALNACLEEQLNSDARIRTIAQLRFKDELEAVLALKDKWPLYVFDCNPPPILDRLADLDNINPVIVWCWFDGIDKPLYEVCPSCDGDPIDGPQAHQQCQTCWSTPGRVLVKTDDS